MGNFDDRPAMDMLPDESFPEAEASEMSLFRRRNLALMGAAALVFWAAVIAALIVVF
jgi:hypothetical protein